jgi:hypothetical protein
VLIAGPFSYLNYSFFEKTEESSVGDHDGMDIVFAIWRMVAQLFF